MPVGAVPEERGLVFRFGDLKDGEVHGPTVVRQVLQDRGWREVGEDDPDGAWHLYWKSGRFKMGEHEEVVPGQQMNHFPKSGVICVKDSLSRIMRRCRTSYGPSFDFYPQAFLLPNEYTRFLAEYKVALTGADGGDPAAAIWICKPTDASRGRGIFLIQHQDELVYDNPCVIQKYISNPLLIGDYKFDLRLYVLVSSFHPLTIYLYQEGVVRFGTQPYSTDNYTNLFAHLTNASIAKQSPSYYNKKPVIGAGSKWSFGDLRKHFASQNWDFEALWARIRALVTLTLVTLPSVVPPASSAHSFELFGFDVVVDDTFKPWLLEVNTSPAMGLDCPVDTRVKVPLIHHTLDALAMGSYPRPTFSPKVAQPQRRAASAGAARARPASGSPGGAGARGEAGARARPTSGSSSGSSAGGRRRSPKWQAVDNAGDDKDVLIKGVPGGGGKEGGGQEEGEDGRGGDDHPPPRRPPSSLLSTRVHASPPPRATLGLSSHEDLMRRVYRPDKPRVGSARRAHDAMAAMEAEAARAPADVGMYERVFPFSDATVRMAARLGGGGQEPVDLIRQVVNEVRVHVLGKEISPAGGTGGRAASARRARAAAGGAASRAWAGAAAMGPLWTAAARFGGGQYSFAGGFAGGTYGGRPGAGRPRQWQRAASAREYRRAGVLS